MNESNATILIGIGNNGRRDDGLGWAFLDAIQRREAFSGQVEYRYQLQVEDAAMISKARRVIFVDASHDAFEDGFCWTECTPDAAFEFTSHMLPPTAVMHLCQDIYGCAPEARLLLIQGTEWGLDFGLGPAAQRNLDRALGFFEQVLQRGFDHSHHESAIVAPARQPDARNSVLQNRPLTRLKQ